jgi:hypothetical protein
MRATACLARNNRLSGGHSIGWAYWVSLQSPKIYMPIGHLDLLLNGGICRAAGIKAAKCPEFSR